MTNEEIFDEIFYDACNRLNRNWYEVFDSDEFDLVIDAINEYFEVANPHLISGYDEWFDEMYNEL